MDILKLARDGRGNYRRDLGWEWTGTKYQQHRFYLGRDRAEAAVRVGRLESLWSAIEGHWNRSERLAKLEECPKSQRPCWSPTTLRIAGAIARGEESVEIDSLPGADAYLELLHN